MKNKLLLIVLLIIIGTFGTREALAGCYSNDPSGVDAISWEIVARGCVKTIENMWIHDDHISRDKLLYGSEYLTVEEYNYRCALAEEDPDYDFNPNAYSYNSLVNYYVLKSVTSLQSNYRRLFSLNGGSLYLISFNINKVDLYGEVELDWLGHNSDQYTKTYGIRYAYSDKNGPLSAGGEPKYVNFYENNRTTFFVCKEHSKCGECDKLVASNCATYDYIGIDALDEIKINKYCPEDHACGFFWVTCNTNNAINNNKAITYITGTIVKSYEGLECLEEKRAEESYFCEEHTCDSTECKFPIIGTNINDGAIKEPTVYQNDKSEFYSRFCIKHFCWERLCRDQRGNANSDDVTRDQYTGRCTGFPEYCSDHYNNHYMNCTKYGCTEPVFYADYEKDVKLGYRYLCNMHMKQDVVLVTCSLCGQRVQAEFCYGLDQGVALCWHCVNGQTGKYIEVPRPDGTVVTVLVNSGNGNAGAGLSGNIGSGLGSLPMPCTHIEYPVPTSVWFKILKDGNQHIQNWTCQNCRKEISETYTHTYDEDGKCICGATNEDEIWL